MCRDPSSSVNIPTTFRVSIRSARRSMFKDIQDAPEVKELIATYTTRHKSDGVRLALKHARKGFIRKHSTGREYVRMPFCVLLDFHSKPLPGQQERSKKRSEVNSEEILALLVHDHRVVA